MNIKVFVVLFLTTDEQNTTVHEYKNVLVQSGNWFPRHHCIMTKCFRNTTDYYDINYHDLLLSLRGSDEELRAYAQLDGIF